MRIKLFLFFFFALLIQVNGQENPGQYYILNSIGYQINLPEETSPETGNTQVHKSAYNNFNYDLGIFTRLNKTFSMGLGLGYGFYDGKDQSRISSLVEISRTHQVRFSIYNRFEHSFSNKIGMIHQLSLNAQTGSYNRKSEVLISKARGTSGQFGFNYIPKLYFFLKENLNLEISAVGAEIIYYEIRSSVPGININKGIDLRMIKGIQLGLRYFLK